MADRPCLLAFDTSAPHCAAALILGDRLLERREEMARGQAERLVPLLEELLGEGGIGWDDLDGIGVGVGPGNFTGIRISVAAARGFALALDRPAIGVSTLEALAYGTEGAVTVAVPGPRESAYVQDFSGGVATGAPRIEDAAPPGALIGTVLATAIARIALSRLGTEAEPPAPLYLRPPDAALPSEPPPRIIP